MFIDPKVLAQLPDNVILQVSVRVGDLRKAITEQMGGPAEITPGDAAKRYGRSAKYWRRKAEAGEIEGAYRDPETERWHLPSHACREHLERKKGGGEQGGGGGFEGRPFRLRGPRRK